MVVTAIHFELVLGMFCTDIFSPMEILVQVGASVVSKIQFLSRIGSCSIHCGKTFKQSGCELSSLLTLPLTDLVGTPNCENQLCNIVIVCTALVFLMIYISIHFLWLSISSRNFIP